MLGGKKCNRCSSKIKERYDFCPYCGLDLRNPEKDMRDYGMLGKHNNVEGFPLVGGMGGFGITDKVVNSLLKNLMKNLDKQMKDIDPNVQQIPNGIKIRFGLQKPQKQKRQKKKVITEDQIQRMSGLPREEAKTNVRRLSDKVVYELKAHGIDSVDDVFVSKLETGYEIKAIGNKKVYVNSLPVALPLKGYSITDQGLTIEFGTE